MYKYLTKYNTTQSYENAMESGQVLNISFPHVSLTLNDNIIHYNKEDEIDHTVHDIEIFVNQSCTERIDTSILSIYHSVQGDSYQLQPSTISNIYLQLNTTLSLYQSKVFQNVGRNYLVKYIKVQSYVTDGMHISQIILSNDDDVNNILTSTQNQHYLSEDRGNDYSPPYTNIFDTSGKVFKLITNPYNTGYNMYLNLFLDGVRVSDLSQVSSPGSYKYSWGFNQI